MMMMMIYLLFSLLLTVSTRCLVNKDVQRSRTNFIESVFSSVRLHLLSEEISCVIALLHTFLLAHNRLLK